MSVSTCDCGFDLLCIIFSSSRRQ